MARISYWPLPSDLRAEENDDCPLVADSFGSAEKMFANLNHFTDDHLVVDGKRVARLHVELHEDDPPREAILVVCELDGGTVEIRRSPATDASAAEAALHHVAPYACGVVEWL